MKKTFLLLLSTLLLTSCAGYINNVYSQLDREEARINNPKAAQRSDKFNIYRKKNRQQMVEQQQDQQASPRLSTLEQKAVTPPVKRQYNQNPEVKKRFTAEDLQDNSGSGSLWTGEGKDNSLFATKYEKQNGDIVVINVMAALKNDITAELKKAYPADAPPPVKAAATTGTDKTGATPLAPAAAPAAEENATEQGKVYDKISSVVIEEINREHILVRGRKTLLYNNRKVTVEVQALAPRKSIAEDDTLDSNSILESTVRVIR